MKEDVIRQVKVAEELAEENIHKSRAQADKILLDARHRAVELRMEIVDAARSKAKQLFELGVKDFEPELERVRQEFQDSIAEDSEKAQKTFDAVVDLVVTRFHEKLGSEEKK